MRPLRGRIGAEGSKAVIVLAADETDRAFYARLGKDSVKFVEAAVEVVAALSGRYDRPADIVGLWVAVLALAITG